MGFTHSRIPSRRLAHTRQSLGPLSTGRSVKVKLHALESVTEGGAGVNGTMYELTGALAPARSTSALLGSWLHYLHCVSPPSACDSVPVVAVTFTLALVSAPTTFTAVSVYCTQLCRGLRRAGSIIRARLRMV
jgi:hypothetical protein